MWYEMLPICQDDPLSYDGAPGRLKEGVCFELGVERFENENVAITAFHFKMKFPETICSTSQTSADITMLKTQASGPSPKSA